MKSGSHFHSKAVRAVMMAGLLIGAALSWAADAGQADWPQFRGPNRDGISPEKGLLTRWPESGPAELWRRPIGEGFSGLTVVGNRLYTMDADEVDEYAVCLAVDDGKELWRIRVGPLFKDAFGNGPRATPTVDGDRVYVLGANGDFLALQSATGEVDWRVDFKTRFESEVPRWGFSTSPLVLNDLLIVEAGGTEGRAIVAFHKRDGSIRWTAQEDKLAYSSPIVVDVHGQRQVVFLTNKELLALSPDGKKLWSTPFVPELSITPASPVFVAPDLLFVSASYDAGAKTVRLQTHGEKVTAEDLWVAKVMRNHFNASVALDGHLYGFDNATLKCVHAASGEQVWARRGFGKGSLILADGHFIILSERGKLHLIKAQSSGYEEMASHQVLTGRTWTQPTLAGGRLYLRNREEMVCLKLKP